ncbi:hypothetical protein H4219_004750 [Mycoemilia scoparia]|uniref:Uncharacterized protein n=1 Tax=Mycoemilia scoparia TaxID=417184 RepID=A0A9W7ZX87_9FUNG|nr:hypothetical protein H4219_004750 [Mycoemilia scoparia]
MSAYITTILAGLFAVLVKAQETLQNPNDSTAMATPTTTTSSPPDTPTDNTSSSPSDRPELSNSALGEWVFLYFGLNVASITLCLVIIMTVVGMLIVRRDIAMKPSFRLSGWIAVVDIIMSSCRIVKVFPNYMDNIPNINSRAVLWMGTFSTLSFMFLTGCIVFQLQMTVIHSKAYIAARLNPFYEVFSIVVPLVLTHPIMYIFNISWDTTFQEFYADVVLWKYDLYSWLTYYAWVLVIWVYCVVVCTLVVFELLPFWRQMNRRFNQLPQTMTSPDEFYYSQGSSKLDDEGDYEMSAFGGAVGGLVEDPRVIRQQLQQQQHRGVSLDLTVDGRGGVNNGNDASEDEDESRVIGRSSGRQANYRSKIKNSPYHEDSPFTPSQLDDLDRFNSGLEADPIIPSEADSESLNCRHNDLANGDDTGEFRPAFAIGDGNEQNSGGNSFHHQPFDNYYNTSDGISRDISFKDISKHHHLQLEIDPNAFSKDNTNSNNNNNSNNNSPLHQHVRSDSKSKLQRHLQSSQQQQQQQQQPSPLTPTVIMTPVAPRNPNYYHNQQHNRYAGQGTETSRNNRHRKHLKFTILRVMIYPLVPIITQTLNIVAQINHSLAYIYTARYILTSLQGILNFIAFMLNPGLDEFWAWLFKGLSNPGFGSSNSGSGGGVRGNPIPAVDAITAPAPPPVVQSVVTAAAAGTSGNNKRLFRRMK